MEGEEIMKASRNEFKRSKIEDNRKKILIDV